LNAQDLAWAEPFLDNWTRRYFSLPAGVEHYRLLCHLSSVYRYRLVIDVGTFHGASALALSACPETRVISFDLVNHRTMPIERENLEFRLGDALAQPDLLAEASLILLDTDHQGGFEREFYQRLEEVSFAGTLLLDDIYLNEAMQSFWHEVRRPKEDWTYLGHWSGTGAVSFGPDA
jgi:predicted O-methyltransferase YrrM